MTLLNEEKATYSTNVYDLVDYLKEEIENDSEVRRNKESEMKHIKKLFKEFEKVNKLWRESEFVKAYYEAMMNLYFEN